MIAFALPLLLLAGQSGAAQEPQPAPPARAATATGLAGDSAPLVKASEAAKAKKKPSTPRKVITNKDLKSGSNLKTNDIRPLAEAEEPKPAAESPSKLADERYRARKAAEERLSTAEQRLAVLEAELVRVEQSYYDENDAARRDTVIRDAYAQARRRRDEGLRELEEAREALLAATPKSTASVVTRP